MANSNDYNSESINFWPHVVNRAKMQYLENCRQIGDKWKSIHSPKVHFDFMFLPTWGHNCISSQV